MRKFWNGNILGLPMALYSAIKSLIALIADRLSTFFWRHNVGLLDRGSLIQHSTTIRYPANIFIAKNVSIGRYCSFMTEFTQSLFTIDEGSQINRNVIIDYSGGLVIGKNVIVSSEVTIYTHSHGRNPKSAPVKTPLIIEDDVWVGAHVIVLEGATRIGQGAIIAAGAVVTREVAPFAIVAGIPARNIKGR